LYLALDIIPASCPGASVRATNQKLKLLMELQYGLSIDGLLQISYLNGKCEQNKYEEQH